MPEKSFRGPDFGCPHRACELYNFAVNINLLPSVIWHGLTNIVADGNGNYELMDTAATNNPSGFTTVRQ